MTVPGATGATADAATGDGVSPEAPDVSGGGEAVAEGEAPAVRRPRRRGVVALAAVAVAGVAGTIAFGLAWAGARTSQDDQTAVNQTARRFLFALTNFDARSVDSAFNTVQGMSTGNFSQQARQVFNSQIRGQLQAAQATTRGQIRYVYIQSLSGDQASVYALVDQTFANNKTTAPQVDELRLSIDMTRVGGQWKVSSLTDLGAPPVSVGPG
ncbi:MAG TPA: hypothetical protein VFH45_09850 [Acidimicrobiales bacterium]|nr:hypothetical protein [Acidimicrobiales bacterium]